MHEPDCRPHLLGSSLLLIIVEVDAAAILSAHVHALPVPGGGVHMLEEAVQQALKGALSGVVVDLPGHALTAASDCSSEYECGSWVLKL